jgi:hypothetical protein
MDVWWKWPLVVAVWILGMAIWYGIVRAIGWTDRE